MRKGGNQGQKWGREEIKDIKEEGKSRLEMRKRGNQGYEEERK